MSLSREPTALPEDLLQMEELAVRYVLEAFFLVQPVEPEVLAGDLLHGSYELFFRLLRIISEALFYNRKWGLAHQVHHGPETPGFLGWGAPGLARGTHHASRAPRCYDARG
jgi:hypothetical protein